MSEHNPHRRTGTGMLVVTWLLIMAGGWWVAEHWLASEANPNRQPVMTPAGEVVLERNRSGHYVADGEINGQRVTFMLDTGATSVALSSALARKLALKAGPGIQIQTANGNTTGYQTRLDSVRLGNIVVRDVGAVYTDAMLDETVLLGMSFLKHVEFTQRDKQLILRQSQR